MEPAEKRGLDGLLLHIPPEQIRLRPVVLDQQGPVVVQEAQADALAKGFPLFRKRDYLACSYIILCDENTMSIWR